MHRGIHLEEGASAKRGNGSNVVEGKAGLLLDDTITNHGNEVGDKVAEGPDANKCPELGVDEEL